MITMTERVRQLCFVEPLAGFSTEEQYTISAIDDRGLLYSLRSVHQPDLRFVLTPAAMFFPDYRPDVSSVITSGLGTENIELFLVLTLGSGLDDATANLRAPIAVASSTGRAVQVILDDESLPMREPLIRG